MTQSPSSRSFGRRLVLPAILLGGGLIAGGLLAELALRVYAHVSAMGARLADFDPMGVQVVPFGTVGYRQKPHGVLRYENGTTARADSLGYRGPEVVRQKPPGVVRIALLGGSTTHGWGVNDDQTIDAYMRRLLSARAPERRFEVINAALDGYDSRQLLERLQYDVVGLSPDVVVINEGINDVGNARFRNLVDADPRTLIWGGPMQRLRYEQEHGVSWWTRAKHYSLLLRLPGFVRYRSNPPLAPDTSAGNPDVADYFERNLRRIADVASTHGIRLILATPASSLRTRYAPNAKPERAYWLRDAETTQVYRDTLAARMKKVSDELAADGRPIVYVHPDVPKDMFLDDAHLTPQGNAMVAALFTDAALRLLNTPPKPVTH